MIQSRRSAGRLTQCLLALLFFMGFFASPFFLAAGEPRSTTVYENRLIHNANPRAILADYPEFVQPLRETARFVAPPLIEEKGADLVVRCWRFSYHARGIIEMQNRLRGDRTAIIVVHPWGIDDGQGWKTPQPSGAAFFCTPEKNKIYRRHAKTVVNPFLKSLRGKAALVMASLPGKEDPIRKKLYRSIRGRPASKDREEGRKQLAAKLKSFSYRGQPLPAKLAISGGVKADDYFRQFSGLDAGAKYNNAGFWNLPIPVVKEIDFDERDVLIYDKDGYPPLRDFLKKQNIRHVLLAGYATDMCVCATTAGYENLRHDFNVFLVGDATLATFPASDSPAAATSTAIAKASLKLFVTQISWVRPADEPER